MTTTKCRPASASVIPASRNACQYARRWLSVSTVEPDLLATTTTVRSSRSASAARTWPGSVVSSTVSGRPRVRVITSGASDEPPIPASTTWSRSASSAVSSASCASSSRLRRWVSTQPSRTFASASASGPHRRRVLGRQPRRDARRRPARPGSRRARTCRPRPRRTRRARRRRPPARPAGRSCVTPGLLGGLRVALGGLVRRAGAGARRVQRLADPVEQLQPAAANFSTPSRSRVAITSAMSTPTDSRSVKTLRAASYAPVMVSPRVSPWSAYAWMTDSGMVLTVPGAISSST